MAILVTTMAVVGAAGYGTFSAVSSSAPSGTSRTCSPVSSIGCGGSGDTNDVVLVVSNLPNAGQTWATVPEGQNVTATVSSSGPEEPPASEYAVDWGDGSDSSQSSAMFSHAYSSAGTYVLSATAVVAGYTHTGTRFLYPVEVTPNSVGAASGEFPQLVTALSNGSSDPAGSPWIHAGGQFTLSGSYAEPPSEGGYFAESPWFELPMGASNISRSNTTTSASATVGFTAPGTFDITLVVPVSGPFGTIYENYTWGVFVGPLGDPLGCALCRSAGASGPVSPHPGAIYAYEVAPGGPTSLDPAVDYETVGGEVIQNVYETLVQYNDSSTATFVPVLSTCVPGPAASGPTSCQSQYGSDLVDGSYWTFPIDANARFYDPSTNSSWGVYPSDVMFSIARTLMWLQTPSQYVYNGWIVGQSLLPSGSETWDGGVHAPWNNTPRYVYGSMLVNDTKYCPPAAMTNAHGCITFVADGSGTEWPELLEFVADPLGASVVPCGWFTSVGASLPGFTTNASRGDGPCLLPGQATSTNTTGFRNYVSGASMTLFDRIIALGDNYYDPQPQVRWNAIGSGPYFLEGIVPNAGVVLTRNPAYAQPNCRGQLGCYPAPHDYASEVYVFWQQNDAVGLGQLSTGQADSVVVYPQSIPIVQNLVDQRRAQLYSVPTLNIFPESFGLFFDSNAVQSASGITTNVPDDFFASVGMRALFAASFPYATYIGDNVVDNVPFYEGEGGAIPVGMGDYYPTNISWPGLNLSTGTWNDAVTNASVVGSAGWWWANITNPRSPHYDLEAAACEVSTCRLPVPSEFGDSPLDQAVDQWCRILANVTGGSIQGVRWDPAFIGPIETPCLPVMGCFDQDMWVDGWLPDYPDPTDYVTPFYLPDQAYTAETEVNETLVQGEWGNYYNGCVGDSGDSFANLSFWAKASPIVPEDCQGTAYSVMVWALDQAAVMPGGKERVLYYDLAEHIANGLVLYVYEGQQLGFGVSASWVNADSIDTNPIADGQLWFQWSGNGMVST